MTDAEAKNVAEGLLNGVVPGGPLEQFVRHALQAVEDRERLVEVAGTFRVVEVADAARRHMHGE
jgi:hypothetical protein